jgi:hypothetical protein
MPTIIKALARGTLGTSNATLYTVPSATNTTVTNIIICNTDSSDQTFSLLLDGIEIFSNTTVVANGVVSMDLKQTLAATKIISGSASVGAVKYHINGVEIS